LPAAPLPESLVSFSRRRLARCTARSIACFFPRSTSSPPRRWQHRWFLSLIDVLPAAPLSASHVSFSCQWLACRAARCIACSFHSSTTFPPRRCLHRLISSLDDVWPSALLAASLVSFTHRLLARRAARCIAGFICLSLSRPPHRSPDRSCLSLARRAGLCIAHLPV
jgi:hypothetical protein